MQTSPWFRLAAALCLAASCGIAAAGPRVLRLGIGLPAASVQGQAVQDFAERVARYSGGSLAIELHAGGQLGNDLSMVGALRAGTLEMSCPDSATLAGLEPGFSAINYPFTFFSETEADAVLDGSWGKQLLSRLPAHQLLGLAYWENGFRHLTNSRRPLLGVADFAGVRMRTMQNPMLVESFRKLGFDAVPMPFPQVYDALREQRVDGQENPLPTIVASRFYEVQRYLTLSRHVYSAHVLLVGKKAWDALDAAQQTALQRAAGESRDFERRLSRDSNERALAELKQRGMQVTVIARPDAERIRNRLRDVLEKYHREIGPALVIEMYVQLGRLRMASAP